MTRKIRTPTLEQEIADLERQYGDAENSGASESDLDRIDDELEPLYKLLDEQEGAKQHEDREREDEIHRLTKSGIPQKYWERRTRADMTVDDDNRQMMDALAEFADAWKSRRMHPARGFLLQGPPGVGKTLVACSLGGFITREHPRVVVRFIRLAEYVNLTRRQIALERMFSDREHPEADRTRSEWAANDTRLREVQECHLLILDDVGKEHSPGSYAASTFEELLRERTGREMPTIMTTNEPLKTWAVSYGAACQDFVFEAADVITVRGTSRRRALSDGSAR